MTKDAVRVGRWVTTRLRGSAGRSAAVLLMLLTLATLVSLWPVAAGPADPREVTLVTRDMAFYVDGSDTPNPVLTMHAGETVRVVLRNEDVGMNHNFEIPAWLKRSRHHLVARSHQCSLRCRIVQVGTSTSAVHTRRSCAVSSRLSKPSR